MSKVESRVSRQGLTMCEGCQCHIKVESTAVTTCPLCGYQTAVQHPPAPMTSSGLRRRSRRLLGAALLSSSLAFSAAPMGCACYGEAPSGYSLGELATDQPANSVIFGDVQEGKSLQKSFILYNDGPSDVTVDKLRLRDNKGGAYVLIDPPLVPFTLITGKENGKRITLKVTPGTMNTTARIEISSGDATNVDENGVFFVKVRHRLLSPDPAWSCGGTIQFGTHPLGATITKECVLKNHGNGTLAIETISYAKEKGGENIDFKLVSPLAPMKVKPGMSIPFQISYTPSDTKPLEDEGAFVLNVNEQVPNLELRLKGASEPARVDVIGVYPPCATDADCETIDSRLTCQEDPFSKEDKCLGDNQQKPLLKLPPTTSGPTSTRAFVIRNLSDQPLTIKSLTWATKQGPFTVKVLVPLPVSILPKKRFQASVVYTPTDTTKASGELQIEFDHTPIPTASLFVESSP